MIAMGKITGSSILHSVGFSGEKDDTATLRIKYRNGHVIDVLEVPYSIFKGLVTAKDKSDYYHRNIHKKFKYQNVS